MTASTQLAHHFVTVAAERLPSSGLAEMKRLLLDYCGVGLSGSGTDTGRISADFVFSMGGAEQSTVLGRRGRVPAVQAAFANAVAEHSIEMDDVDDEALFHYGPPVMSAAIAVAEWRHASGAELLTAAFLGCEMVNRLSLGTNPSLRDRGFHTTPTCGVFGATVAAGRLLDLNESQMVSAMGLAGAQASGLMEMYGPSMQKRINPGPAARNGVTAAVLASMGFTGADSILEGQRGFGNAFAGGVDVPTLLKGLGEDFPVVVEYKAYSAARPIHNAIDCALALRVNSQFSADDIVAIDVDRHPAWAEYHLNHAPTTYHEAQVSLPYSVAVALIEGRALPPQYADDQLRRPDLTALMRKVTVHTDATLPRGVSCRMTLRLSDGSALCAQVDHPTGSVRNPMSYADLEAKFLGLAGPVIGTEQTHRLRSAIDAVDEIADVATLMEMTQGSDL